MVDLINISAAILVGYAVFMGLIILLIKIFFPFLTKEKLRRQKRQIRQYKVNFRHIG